MQKFWRSYAILNTSFVGRYNIGCEIMHVFLVPLGKFCVLMIFKKMFVSPFVFVSVKVYFQQGWGRGWQGGENIKPFQLLLKWSSDFKSEWLRFTLHQWCCIVTLGIRAVLLQSVVTSCTLLLLFSDWNVSFFLKSCAWLAVFRGFRVMGSLKTIFTFFGMK